MVVSFKFNTLQLHIYKQVKDNYTIVVHGGAGGLIFFIKTGTSVMVFNATGMFRGYIKANEKKRNINFLRY